MCYATAAFLFWGFIPIYFKAVQNVPSLTIACHRIVWSIPFTVLLITLINDWKNLWDALLARKVLIILFLSTILFAINSVVYIYAIVIGRILEASLGYFINPLINVLLGMIFLRERLRPLQILAVLMAVAGTLNLSFEYGKIPWIALSLAFSFSLYGLLRKTVRIESLNGLFVETSLITPFALAYLMYPAIKGVDIFGQFDFKTGFLLVMSGIVSTLPLLWFTSGARRLRYSTIGLLQYLGPSLNLLLAVFYYHEAFTISYFITFILIWTGLAVFILDSFLFTPKIEVPWEAH